MRQLEEELRQLERGELDPDEVEEPPEKARRTAEEADAPEPDDEDAGGRLRGLTGRFKRSRGSSEEDEPPEAPEPEETPGAEELSPPEDDDAPASRLKGLTGRLSRSKDEPEEEDAAGDDAPDEAPAAAGLLGRLKRGKDDAPDEEGPDVAPLPEQADDAPEEVPAEAGGVGSRLKGRFKRDKDEADEPEEPPEEEPARAARTRPPPPAGHPERWQSTEEGWRRRSPEEIAALPPPEAGEPSETKARALLSRFRKSEADEPDEPVPPLPAYAGEEEEEGRRRGGVLWVWILLILLGIALIGIIAYAFLGDDGGIGAGGGDLAAALAAPSATTNPDGEGILVVTGEAVSFDASGTEGEVDEYRWDFGDGRTTTTATATTTHFYAQPGSYTATVTAVAGGDEGTATLPVVVVRAPEAVPRILVDGEPVASPGEAGNNAFVGVPVTLDGTESTADESYPITSYAWDVDGDGTPDATGETTSFTFSEAGMYMVVLTVTDELGHTDSADAMVHVGGRTEVSDTAPMAFPTDTANEHPVEIAMGRLETTPVQVTATLNYTAPDAGVNPNLDLVLVDPDGNEFQAEDDGGSGTETLTLTSADLASLGTWTVRVVHTAPDLNTIEYTVVVEVVY